ncbi:hypothetical protein [Winogradskyella pacifica]|uniref:hypothetical protein n=1 Tax=Winogradskyella pacifica TaxID=664642 RepID=UPI0015CD7046|nr:hypothetical protein [Winogradskyella pacifica]
MRLFTTSLLVIFFLTSMRAQEVQIIKSKFYISNSLPFDSGDIHLKKTITLNFDSLTSGEQKVIIKKYKKLKGKELQITITNPKDSKSTITYTDYFKMDMLTRMDFSVERDVNLKTKTKKGFVKFTDSGKIIVNPYLTANEVKDSTGKKSYVRDIYSYQLKNRQKAKLWFNEITISTVTIPLKYRPRIAVDNDPNPPNEDEAMAREYIPEDFSSSFNVNLFLGVSIGQTSFFYRKDVGNITNTWKVTAGFFIGASTVKLNKTNTDFSSNKLDTEVTKGLASLGFGLTYSFNKINVGAFYGFDYALGSDVDLWNYNKEPWIGVGLGLNLFKF